MKGFNIYFNGFNILLQLEEIKTKERSLGQLKKEVTTLKDVRVKSLKSYKNHTAPYEVRDRV